MSNSQNQIRYQSTSSSSFPEANETKGHFAVVGSKILLHDSRYSVSVTSDSYDTPQVLKIAIKGTDKDNNNYENSQNVKLENGKAQLITYNLEKQNVGNYKLEVKSLSGNDFEKSVNLHMNTKKYSVFVQTDKAVYKPSDKIQFRVLLLNSNTKPYETKNIQIHITDGAQNRIKQFENVKFIKGVYQNELQLSDSPVLGDWLMHIQVNNDKEITKQFEVAEYVLPKFEVIVNSNQHLTYKDEKIKATVKAKYTFGKSAKGNATLRAKQIPSWKSGYFKEVVKKIEVDGKKEVEFDIKKELNIEPSSYEKKTVELFATFTEELSGREQNGSATVTIHPTPHKMELKKSNEKFKPGLPFRIDSYVNFHDGTPVTDLKNPVEFTITFYQLKTEKCEFPTYGYYSNIYPHCDTQTSYDINKEIFLKDGLAELRLEIPTSSTKATIKAKYLETTKQMYNIKKYESESGEYIQTKLITKDLHLDNNVEIELLSTKSLDHIYYHVIQRGDVIVSSIVNVPNNVKNYTFIIKPKLAMIPKSQLIVYYIKSNGEVISDKIELNFGSRLKNFLKIKLSAKQTKPGDFLDITVKSNPNSFVGLLGVDQSVMLLKKGNDIESSIVVDELKNYHDVDVHNYRWHGGHSEYSFFKSANAILITNAKEEYRQPQRPYFPHFRPMHDYSFRGFGGLGGMSSASSASSSFLNSRFDGSPVYRQELVPEIMPLTSDFPEDRMLSGARNTISIEPKQIEIRKNFPETWLFDSFELDERGNGSTIISKKVPDTITSWVITGFAIDPVTGLGLTKQAEKFSVFQPFFVSTNLPYSIKRGEVIAIPIIVFNYMDHDTEAEVTLFNYDNEFEFTEINAKENDFHRKKRETETQRKIIILAKSESGTSVSFMIKPLKVGHITIKVTASSQFAGDGFERELIVEPEGITQYMNKAVFIDLRINEEFKTSIDIDIPSTAVPDSTKIEASAIGDILGPALDNLDKLIKLPYGCGEQNMLNFVPNILVLEYFTTLNKLTKEIEAKAKKYMESGYQRELTYKHDDGSYSAFGKSDKSGSTWLTAFVAKSFNKASKFILVEEAIIKQALDFLAKIQGNNGSFPEVGQISHKDMQGGSSKGLALTAYVLTAFLENQISNGKYQQTIEKALDYIVANIQDVDDNYPLAIASYALQLAKHQSKDSYTAKLDSQSENKNGMKYWEKIVAESDKNNSWNYQPNSVNVEMSAYAMQAFIEAGNETEAVKIMKWLITQRNENGGFQSTQDTVVGLQALSKLASRIYVENSTIDIKLDYNNGFSTQLNVNPSNSLILQKHELPSNVKNIQVNAMGKGFSILQLSYKYNLNINGSWPRFIINPQMSQNSNKNFMHLTVCASFIPDDLSNKSNMAVMEVTLPSGFTFDTDHHATLLGSLKVKKVELKNSDTVVIVYFDDIDANNICPEIKAYRTHNVANQKPAPIVVYDYYDNSRRATEFYNPPEVSLCDICEGDECNEICEVDVIQVI